MAPGCQAPIDFFLRGEDDEQAFGVELPKSQKLGGMIASEKTYAAIFPRRSGDVEVSVSESVSLSVYNQ